MSDYMRSDVVAVERCYGWKNCQNLWLCDDCMVDTVQMTCTKTNKIRNHISKTIYMYEGKYAQQPGHRLMCTSCQDGVRERCQEQQPT